MDFVAVGELGAEYYQVTNALKDSDGSILN